MPSTASVNSAGPRKRFLALNPKQQARWLDPAEDEFAQHGFSAASLNRILTRAGASKGQSYYYFADKADLYRAVIERAFARFVAQAGMRYPQPVSAADFWRMASKHFARVSQIMKRDDRLAALARGIHRDAPAQDALTDFLAMLNQRLARLIEIGQEVGAVRKDMPIELLVAAAFGAAREIDYWFAFKARDMAMADVLKLNQQAVALVFTMLAPPKTAGAVGQSLLRDEKGTEQ